MVISPTTSEASFAAFKTQREGCDEGRWRMSAGRGAWAVIKVFIRLLWEIGSAAVRQPVHPVPRPCPLPPLPICNR